MQFAECRDVRSGGGWASGAGALSSCQVGLGAWYCGADVESARLLTGGLRPQPKGWKRNLNRRKQRKRRRTGIALFPLFPPVQIRFACREAA
jgi:hypothetical protein